MNRGGRPRVFVRRKLEDFPPPTPLETPCRIWQGALDRDGYGVLTANKLGKERVRAHRWVYAVCNGLTIHEIPRDVVIRHRCDNRPCFRLSHLEPGTQADNVDDARKRNRLGGAMALRPSEIELLFTLHAQGRSARSIWMEHFGHRSYQSITWTLRLGREGFDENWNRILVPEPVSKYAAWRGEPVPEVRLGRQAADD